MKMKKKLFALFTVLLLLSLTACGGSAFNSSKGGSSAPQTAADVNYNGYAAADSADSWDMPEAEWAAADEAPMDTIYGGAPENAKIIYTADVNLETKEFDQAAQTLTAVVTELGGYFESRSLSQGGRYRSMDCAVRIPAENFLAFLDRAGEAAHVTYRHEYSDDVSEVYYDQEARLTTQRTKLARLQELISQAENMADIITIESAISDTELQIEYLTGSLRKYDSLISYSTVNISLYEVYRLSTDEEAPLTFGDRFANAFLAGFQNGLAALDDFAISIARNWMTLLILAVIVVIAVLLLRRRKRKKAASYAMPPVEPRAASVEKEEKAAKEEPKE